MRLYKRGTTWYADLREEGGGRVSTGCTDYHKARTASKGIAKRLTRGQDTRYTLGHALERAYAEHYVGSKNVATVRSQLNILAASLSNVQLDDIDTPLAMAWVKQWRAEGRTEATCNRYISLVSKVMQLATQWGWSESTIHVPRFKESKGRIRVLTIDEQRLARGLLGTHEKYHWMGGLMTFLLDTGCRLSEALDTPEVDRNEAAMTGRWSIWVNKGDRPRTIPLSIEAQAALKEHSWKGKSVKDAQAGWKWVRQAMGLDTDKEFVLHALRHTCASTLVNRGMDIYAVSKFLGHASVATTERYAHLNDSSLDVLADCLNSNGSLHAVQLNA